MWTENKSFDNNIIGAIYCAIWQLMIHCKVSLGIYQTAPKMSAFSNIL